MLGDIAPLSPSPTFLALFHALSILYCYLSCIFLGFRFKRWSWEGPWRSSLTPAYLTDGDNEVLSGIG